MCISNCDSVILALVAESVLALLQENVEGASRGGVIGETGLSGLPSHEHTRLQSFVHSASAHAFPQCLPLVASGHPNCEEMLRLMLSMSFWIRLKELPRHYSLTEDTYFSPTMPPFSCRHVCGVCANVCVQMFACLCQGPRWMSRVFPDSLTLYSSRQVLSVAPIASC